MRVAIVGCGGIGLKRARSLGASGRLVAVSDIQHQRAQQLAAAYAGCEVEPSWESCVARCDVDLVIVSTVNAVLAP
jgi:predicted dehydrogenase